MNEQENQVLFNLPLEDGTTFPEMQSQAPKDTELNAPALEDEPASLRGTLIDFLDHIQGGFQSPTETVKSSSTMEEIQEQQAQLQYRRAWLQAILNETDREIEIISKIIDSKE